MNRIRAHKTAKSDSIGTLICIRHITRLYEMQFGDIRHDYVALLRRKSRWIQNVPRRPAAQNNVVRRKVLLRTLLHFTGIWPKSARWPRGTHKLGQRLLIIDELIGELFKETEQNGDAENAGQENAGLENAGLEKKSYMIYKW